MVKVSRPFLILPLILCILSCTLAKGYGQAFKWDTVKLGGIDYVSLRNMKTFYGFQKISFAKSIVLENRGVKLELRSGSQRCKMNGVLFILSHPIKAHNGKYLLSRTDLVKLIDPVMRPANIGNAKVFNTVIIDAGHGYLQWGFRILAEEYARAILMSFPVIFQTLPVLLWLQLSMEGHYFILITQKVKILVSVIEVSSAHALMFLRVFKFPLFF